MAGAAEGPGVARVVTRPGPSGGAQVALLADGRRLHLHHGPIDVVAEGFGPPAAVAMAYDAVAGRFRTVLAELVAELELLRRPIGAPGVPVGGAVARRMAAAVWPHREVFVTPMAAVAGAVADELLATMLGPGGLAKAYVNDGGDIAWHLTPGQRLRTAIVADQDRPAIDGTVELDHALPARGLATSGWRGRSLSLGIADAVTVLADSAASADAAATLIANAVDLDHPAIRRRPACHLRDDTDLGDLPVTVEVGPLPAAAIDEALARGAGRAEAMRRAGLIVAASLMLRGHVRVIGPVAPQLTRWTAE
jgi:ApbE superfamily uncharacterized protein (UPF0280 family)